MRTDAGPLGQRVEGGEEPASGGIALVMDVGHGLLYDRCQAMEGGNFGLDSGFEPLLGCRDRLQEIVT